MFSFRRAFLPFLNRQPFLLPTSFQQASNAAFVSKVNEIAKDLDIPERPKRPINSYMRFLQEVRPNLHASTTSVTEVTRQAASQWKNLSESQKQKYHEAFEKENVEYQKQLEAYKHGLSPMQKQAIKNIRSAKSSKSQEEKRERKSLKDSLGKPKRPLSSYFLFYAEHTKKSSNFTPAQAKSLWDDLNDAQKRQYVDEANSLLETYKKQLDAWEKDMLAKGHVDLVRQRTKTIKAK